MRKNPSPSSPPTIHFLYHPIGLNQVEFHGRPGKWVIVSDSRQTGEQVWRHSWGLPASHYRMRPSWENPPRAAIFMPLAEPHDYSNIEALIYIKSSSILHNSIGDYKETLPKRKVENEYGRRVISA